MACCDALLLPLPPPLCTTERASLPSSGHTCGGSPRKATTRRVSAAAQLHGAGELLAGMRPACMSRPLAPTCQLRSRAAADSRLNAACQGVAAPPPPPPIFPMFHFNAVHSFTNNVQASPRSPCSAPRPRSGPWAPLPTWKRSSRRQRSMAWPTSCRRRVSARRGWACSTWPWGYRPCFVVMHAARVRQPNSCLLKCLPLAAGLHCIPEWPAPCVSLHASHPAVSLSPSHPALSLHPSHPTPLTLPPSQAGTRPLPWSEAPME